jgi:glutaredoxin 3
MMANVVIYTKPGCPYCAKAKTWYREQGIDFVEKNAQDDLSSRREMFSFSHNNPTVPVIVVDGKLKEIGWQGRG